MLLAVPTFFIVMLVIIAVMALVLIGLSIWGRRLEKRQAEQNEQIQKNAQPVSMLVIDKKRLRLKESGLPEQVLSQSPWYTKNAKLPIVKVKIGPQIMNLISEEAIFDSIPVKREVRAMVSGLYIISVKGLHGKIEVPEKPKKGFRAWVARKRDELQKERNLPELKDTKATKRKKK